MAAHQPACFLRPGSSLAFSSCAGEGPLPPAALLPILNSWQEKRGLLQEPRSCSELCEGDENRCWIWGAFLLEAKFKGLSLGNRLTAYGVLYWWWPWSYSHYSSFPLSILSGFKAADSSGNALCMKPATHPDSGAGRRRLHSVQVTLVKLSVVGPSMDFYSTLGFRLALG